MPTQCPRFGRILALVTFLAASALTAGEPVPLAPGQLEKVIDQAGHENKHLYVAFLGKGWSLSSKRFEEAVLNDPAFVAFAKEKLVFFPVEARRTPKLSPEETAVLQSWVIHFDIKSYPTLILIAPDGQEILRHGYKDIEGPDYIRLLQNLLPGQE